MLTFWSKYIVFGCLSKVIQQVKVYLYINFCYIWMDIYETMSIFCNKTIHVTYFYFIVYFRHFGQNKLPLDD
jgi:hypothetical protein